MFNTPTEKSIKISAITGNPKLADTIKQALKSTPGSTKRKNAASLLKMAGAKRGNFGMAMDGRGGGEEQPQMIWDNNVGNFVPNPLYSSVQKTVPGVTPSPQITSTKISPDPEKAGVPESYRGMLDEQMQFYPKGHEQWGSAINAPGGLTKIFYPRPDSKKEKEVKITEPGQGTTDEQWDTTGELGYSSMYSTPQDDVQSFLPEGTTLDDIFGNEYIDEEELTGFVKLLYEAQQSGMGKNTFANWMMDSNDRMKMLEEWSGYPEGSLPRGAIWANQIPEISKRLKEELGINSMYESLAELRKEGLTLKEDMALKTTRDEYIDRLSDMIEKTKTQITDTSNYFIKRRLEKYLNHLYVKIGKEEKRYSDYLNEGIDVYNNQVKELKNDYDAKYKDFTELLGYETTITKERYDTLKTMLKEMYDNVDNRYKIEGQILDNKLKRLEEIQKQMEIIKDASGDMMDMTEEDKRTVATIKKLSGVSSFTPEEQFILSQTLSGDDMEEFAYKLKDELAKNSNANVLDLLEKFVREKEAGGVPLGEEIF